MDTKKFTASGISDERYSTQFGFTQQEVDELLREADLTDKREVFRSWYDGFRFGNAEMYSPWDVLCYLKALRQNKNAKPQAYWSHTSSNDVIADLLKKSDKKTRNLCQDLIDGKTITVPLIENINYDQIDVNSDAVWSLLYLTGYLTKAAENPNGREAELRLTNREIREMFIDDTDIWLKNYVEPFDLTALLWEKDAEKLQKEINVILWNTISYFDYREDFYHGFMTGLFVKREFQVSSNREMGLGRSDLCLEEVTFNPRYVIFEFKYAHNAGELEILAKEALDQIEAKGYARSLEEAGSTVVRIGVAFYKKQCRVFFG